MIERIHAIVIDGKPAGKARQHLTLARHGESDPPATSAPNPGKKPILRI